jgi:hypothetical protein
MATEIESGAVIPTRIHAEAWEAAMVLDREMASLLVDYGIHQKEGRSKTTEVMAKMVQLAINKALEKFVAERAELDKLAHSMAYENAETIIRSESLPYCDEDEQQWFEVEPEGEVDLVDALRYLELRGLLDRHPENPNRVQVRDESEATA